MFGELIPMGGGDPIPLLKKNLLIGRRESCDIVLRFSNVSAHHCQLTVAGGYWYVNDKNSRNGIKVNGVRVDKKRIDPGDILSVSKHKYKLEYSPAELGAVGPPPSQLSYSGMFGTSLLERAGLPTKDRGAQKKPSPDSSSRFEILEDMPTNNFRKKGQE